MRICSVKGCKNKHKAQGMCRNHYRTYRLSRSFIPVDERRRFKSDNLRMPNFSYSLEHSILAWFHTLPVTVKTEKKSAKKGAA